MKRILASLLFAVLPFATTSAQEAPAQTPKPQAQAPKRPAETGQAVNIKIDLTITDQSSEGPATVRTVSLLALDNSVGRIRSVAPLRSTGELNVDARPRILQPDRLQLALTVEYRPGVERSNEEPPSLSQSLTVLLKDGTALLVSQSADPNSDRKVKVEVKATVLK
jgi:hypothetical protein